MESNEPARDLGAGNAEGDYEYDEAHDVSAGQMNTHGAHHRYIPPPQSNIGGGGDYGYDEAHDFGTR